MNKKEFLDQCVGRIITYTDLMGNEKCVGRIKKVSDDCVLLVDPLGQDNMGSWTAFNQMEDICLRGKVSLVDAFDTF